MAPVCCTSEDRDHCRTHAVAQVAASVVSMSGHKRHFPYYSAVPEIELKKRDVTGGIHPGKESAEVRAFIPGNFQESPASASHGQVC